jgi:hypothetical protein
MELVKIIPDPIEFPSIYDFTFILFGNSGELRIHVRIFDEEAVKHSKYDLTDAKEPKLLARFRRHHRRLDVSVLEEYYQLDFEQEPVVLVRFAEDFDKEPNRIIIFANNDRKYWLPSWKSEVFRDRVSFLALDEAERRIFKEMYYNTKQILFVHPEIIGKEV